MLVPMYLCVAVYGAACLVIVAIGHALGVKR